jgi:glutamate formiminotransferase
LLHQTSDTDHNRTVLTFAGRPEAVCEAAFRAVRAAVERIDLTRQSGVHPRIGAADVVPLVPLEGIGIEECAAGAASLGARIWEELRVPVYLYEAAAREPERRNLEMIRKGGFEGLRDEVRRNPARKPDFGGPGLHPSAGATVVGARNVLVAFNVLLDTADVSLARAIARKVRASSGGLPTVKAIGVLLASKGRAQVSMNLTDYRTTPPRVAFDAVAQEAAASGVGVVSSEIVGLIPAAALWPDAAGHLRCENLSPDVILDNRIATLE